MADIIQRKKSCSENPLKSSAPLGAALAYLGIEETLPLFHGSQGCTAFALVLAVRHFKEAIPLQTTAMNEASTILGGADHVEEALVNIAKRNQPKLIGIASTALVETRGEDFVGDLGLIRLKRRELDGIAVAFASTPDFEGALEEGWAAATKAVITELVKRDPQADVDPMRINLLPGVHQTPGDIEELRGIIESFGLVPTVLPDISTSLDGTVPGHHVATSAGGTPLSEIRDCGRAAHTIAIGEHMRSPAQALQERTETPYTVLPHVTGLGATDDLIALLMKLSGRAAPMAMRRQRSQLLDAMMDAHFWYSGHRIAIAADPDLLRTMAEFCTTMGATVCCAVSSTRGVDSLDLTQLPCPEVHIGDLGDLEDLAAAQDAELLITHSHGRRAAERLMLPLYRIGFPVFDRLGIQHRCTVGYRGTRELAYALANEFMGSHHEITPSAFLRDPEKEQEEKEGAHA